MGQRLQAKIKPEASNTALCQIDTNVSILLEDIETLCHAHNIN